MTSAPAHLCVTCVLVFSSFLALVSAAFAIIIGNHELFPRAPRKPPYWITPFDLLICLRAETSFSEASASFPRP